MKNAEKYEKAKELVKTGLSRLEACEKVGLKISTFGYYSKKKNKQPVVIANPQTTTNRNLRVFVFEGDAREIANILRGIE